MALKITHKNGTNIECTSDLSFSQLYLGFGVNFPPREIFYYMNFVFFTKEDNKTPISDRIKDIKITENIKMDMAIEDFILLNPTEMDNRAIAKFLELNPTYNLVVV